MRFASAGLKPGTMLRRCRLACGMGEGEAVIAPDWFGSLEGSWRLARKISGGHRFDGEARFVLTAPGCLALSETGELRLSSGQRLKSAQSWIWRSQAAWELSIEYPPQRGGGTYHNVNLAIAGTSLAGNANHICGADRYLGQYRLALFGRKAPAITIRQHICGPAKEFVVLSRLSLRVRQRTSTDS